MIYSYQKASDDFTTYILREPDYADDQQQHCTELCTISDTTYVHVPDDLTLPEQPEQITLVEVTLTDELREQIKK